MANGLKKKIKNTAKFTLGAINAWINGVKIGKHVYIGRHFKCNVREAGSVVIGNHVGISTNSTFLTLLPDSKIIIRDHVNIFHHFQINSANYVEIKSNVIIAPFVFICDHNHRFEDISRPIAGQGIDMKPNAHIIIDEDTWIGTKVTILGTVHVGKHCVIGANSVVTKDIPDYSIVAGIPAKIIKRYNFSTKQWEKV
ncbi:MAG: acyltransferase [Prevotella sp.]|nr:acyltransferase [Prevotella sp.]